MTMRHALVFVIALLAGCSVHGQEPAVLEAPNGTSVATFGGGCFWCMEPPFDAVDGVLATTSGFMGGTVANPTYDQVSRGGTGHIEVVQVTFDSSRVSYQELLEVYWTNVDPVAVNRQFCDVGPMYRSAIFVHSPQQRELAETSKRSLQASGRFDRPIATEIHDASAFYAAEDYHQDFYLKNPRRYRQYRQGCGRDARLREIWGSR
jgi:peptide-methionine (S)-S-oxide reductase